MTQTPEQTLKTILERFDKDYWHELPTAQLQSDIKSFLLSALTQWTKSIEGGLGEPYGWSVEVGDKPDCQEEECGHDILYVNTKSLLASHIEAIEKVNIK